MKRKRPATPVMAIVDANVSDGMPKKTPIEPGDRLVVELPVVATWPDMGKITVTSAGTRFTCPDDNPKIRDVLTRAQERAERGRKRIGTFAFTKHFGDGDGRS